MNGTIIRKNWLNLILSGQKTMEVKSQYKPFKRQTIALGYSSLVRGYGLVKDIITIPYNDIPKYQSQHLATQWLMTHYKDRTVYGYLLEEIRVEKRRVPYPRSYGSVWFRI